MSGVKGAVAEPKVQRSSLTEQLRRALEKKQTELRQVGPNVFEAMLDGRTVHVMRGYSSGLGFTHDVREGKAPLNGMHNSEPLVEDPFKNFTGGPT